MTYDDIAAVFMATPAEPIPDPAVVQSPARRLRDALEPIATQGWWSREAAERITALGLGFFDGYVWGRAAALGEPAPAVVAVTFGVFDAAMIGGVYEQGRAATSRAEVLAARAAGATESLQRFASPAEASAIADPLLMVIAGLDALARPLFAALRALALPDSPHGRLWRAAELVREHRGDGHLAVAAAAGVSTLELNVWTELWLGYGLGEYSGTRGLDALQLSDATEQLQRRGWMADGSLTDAGRAARDGLEEDTDATQQPLVDALGDGLDALVDAALAVSDRIVTAKSFPTDPRKRAAG